MDRLRDEAAAMRYCSKALCFLNTKLYSANRDRCSDGMDTVLQTVTCDLSLKPEVFRLQHETGRKSHIFPKQNFL